MAVLNRFTEAQVLNVDTSNLAIKGTALQMTKYVGDSYQRDTENDVRVYLRILVDKGSYKDGKYVFNIGGGFWFNGFINAVPFELGCVGIDSNGNDVDGVRVTNQEVWLINGEMIYQNASGETVPDWWYKGITVEVTPSDSYTIGVLPYIKLGGIIYGGSDFNAGNDWDIFGTSEGILIPHYTIWENALWDEAKYTNWWTHNGRSANLPCWIMFGGQNSSLERSYSNCPVKVAPNMPVYVYDSSGVAQQAKGIWVYDSSGNPQPAKSITVYGANGVQNTITL